MSESQGRKANLRYCRFLVSLKRRPGSRRKRKTTKLNSPTEALSICTGHLLIQAYLMTSWQGVCVCVCALVSAIPFDDPFQN